MTIFDWLLQISKNVEYLEDESVRWHAVCFHEQGIAWTMCSPVTHFDITEEGSSVAPMEEFVP